MRKKGNVIFLSRKEFFAKRKARKRRSRNIAIHVRLRFTPSLRRKFLRVKRSMKDIVGERIESDIDLVSLALNSYLWQMQKKISGCDIWIVKKSKKGYRIIARL